MKITRVGKSFKHKNHMLNKTKIIKILPTQKYMAICCQSQPDWLKRLARSSPTPAWATAELLMLAAAVALVDDEATGSTVLSYTNIPLTVATTLTTNKRKCIPTTDSEYHYFT